MDKVDWNVKVVILVPKVLLLPLLQIPSGHHQAAEAVAYWLAKEVPNLKIEKREILSSFHPLLERIVSSTYLKWIHQAPQTYNWLYRRIALNQKYEREQKYRHYEFLFRKQMERVITQTEPDLLLCSHALPSFLLSQLKLQGKITIPIVNIYTDYFINTLWGRTGIDLHLVPSTSLKELLMERGIPENKIIVTGIPVDYAFHKKRENATENMKAHKQRYQLLVAGGSIGIGFLNSFIKEMTQSTALDYYILCGNNKKLYNQLRAVNVEHITPLPYISCRNEMNKLYDKMDGIITKPGGITISESLYKGLPIFIHIALPGQEQMNLQFLQRKKLGMLLQLDRSIEEQICTFFNHAESFYRWQDNHRAYMDSLQWEDGLKWLTNRLNVVLDK